MSEKVSINISKELYEKAKKYVEESGGDFKSVEEFVEFVLKEVLEEEEEEERVYTPEEEEEIKKRLRSLGYL
ncbi:MAG: CopG family transcriptional regulator [Thermoprotei archaeon]|nr:MAG: CopG family transcriptional regulator [Thermoprotei archaeon]HDD63823.1 CopG family transcriptional regulator [Thermoprotei archaeon]